MDIVYYKRRIILKGSTEDCFSEKMKKPDLNIMRKRDAYFREIDKTFKVSHNEKGNIVLKSK